MIKPKNPCSCKAWANYALKYNKTGNVTSYKCANEVNPELKSLLMSEIDFITKLSVLYKYLPQNLSKDDFISKVKNIVKKEDLKIFA